MLLLDVPRHASSKSQLMEGLSSIEQRSACNWIKVVSQRIDPFNQRGMRFLERFQSLPDDLVFAHDLGEIAFSDEHSCLQLSNPTILGLAFPSQSLQSILTLL